MVVVRNHIEINGMCFDEDPYILDSNSKMGTTFDQEIEEVPDKENVHFQNKVIYSIYIMDVILLLVDRNV